MFMQHEIYYFKRRRACFLWFLTHAEHALKFLDAFNKHELNDFKHMLSMLLKIWSMR